MIKIYFDNILIDSNNYVGLSNNFKLFDEEFYLGSTSANTFKLEIPYNCISSIPQEVKIKINDIDYANLIVDKYEILNNNILSMTLVDKMILFNFKYDASLIVPCTTKQIIENICSLVNIQLGNNSFINDDVVVDYYDNRITAREYIGYIAELNGGYAIIGQDGKLYLKQFNSIPFEIETAECEDFKVGEKHEIERVVFDNGLLKYETSSDENLETLYLNPNNVYINDLTTFNNIANQILNFTFYNCETGNCEINNNLIAGDLIKFIDGESEYITIAQYSLKFNGKWLGGYSLKINSKQQQETKQINSDEKYKSLSVELNRQKNELILVAEEQSNITKNLETSKEEEDTNISLNDSGEKETAIVKLDGRSTQETSEIMPSPDFPSEVECIKGKNLFGLTISDFNNGLTYGETKKVELTLKPNTEYTLSTNSPGKTLSTAKILFNGGSSSTYGVFLNKPKTTITDSDGKLFIAIRIDSLDDVFNNYWIQLEEGTQTTPYLPYQNISVDVVGKNLLDYNLIRQSSLFKEETTYQNRNSLKIGGNNTSVILIPNLKNNTQYTVSISAISTVDDFSLSFLYDDNTTSSIQYVSHSTTIFTKYSKTSTENKNLIGIRIRSYSATIGYIAIDDLQLKEGIATSEYEQYQHNQYLVNLNGNELCSLPNGVKDELIIENGIARIEKKIGKIVLDGSNDEEWSKNGSNQGYGIAISGIGGINDATKIPFAYCNFLKVVKQDNIYTGSKDNAFSVRGGSVSKIYMRIDSSLTTVALFKNWLSTHNTTVYYELATPETIELGEVEQPSTYDSISNISNSEDTNMYVKYYTNSNLNTELINKTELAQMKIESDKINLRVSNAESGIDSTNKKIDETNFEIDSTKAKIEIISTNIDKTTGEVREVTTKNGFTFNENGLNISTSNNTFNAQHTNDGSYYRDGTQVISSTTKDGFLATNLKNKGQHQYSYDEINNNYDFIEERIEVDDEICYATFFNGEE